MSDCQLRIRGTGFYMLSVGAFQCSMRMETNWTDDSSELRLRPRSVSTDDTRDHADWLGEISNSLQVAGVPSDERGKSRVQIWLECCAGSLHAWPAVHMWPSHTVSALGELNAGISLVNGSPGDSLTSEKHAPVEEGYLVCYPCSDVPADSATFESGVTLAGGRVLHSLKNYDAPLRLPKGRESVAYAVAFRLDDFLEGHHARIGPEIVSWVARTDGVSIIAARDSDELS